MERPAVNSLAKIVTQNPLLIILLVLGISVLAFLQIYDIETHQLKLQLDPSVDRLLPKNSPKSELFEQHKLQFGDDEAIIVAIHGEPVFTDAHLSRVAKLGDQLGQLPGVHSVLSLATANNLRNDGEIVDLDTFKYQFDTQQATAAQLLHDANHNPMYKGLLVAEDGLTSTLIVRFKGLKNKDFINLNIAEKIKQTSQTAAPNLQVWVTGSQVIKAASVVVMTEGFKFMLPTIAILVSLFLLMAFHSLRGLILPILTITLALLWTLAVMASLNIPMNVVTSIIPPIIITLGLAYALHVLTEYYGTLDSPDNVRKDRVLDTINEIALPMFVTGLTTAAGFFALYFNPLNAVREFAWISALGVGFTVLLSLTFFPAILQIIGAKNLQHPPGKILFSRAASMLATFDIRWRKPILATGVVILICGLLAATQIKVGSNYVADFPATAKVRTDYENINQHLGGANPFAINIETHYKDALTDPDILKHIADLQVWLNAQPEIDSTVSIADHIVLLNQVLGDGQAQLPADRDTIKQLLIFGGGEELDSYMNARLSASQINVRSNIDNTADVSALISRIETRIQKIPRPLELNITGNTVLLANAIDQIAEGQGASIGIALLVVFIILATLFTSWRSGLVALVPNLLPIGVYFGALGITGIPLTPTTSLIACIVLGIAVDDTIHYLARFNVDARKVASEQQATYTTLRNVLRPVSYTTAALVIGFLVISAGGLENQYQFGILAAFTMAFAWLTDITFTPALASSVKIVTLWDTLRLDLGEDPQHSIPLFKGLSLRQARVFALNTNMFAVPAGTQVIQQGADAKSIYIIVDGELAVWAQVNGSRVELATVARGAVIGEVGHFGSKRTANVDATTPARLLKVDSDDLETLSVRHPRIAATVLRNLNKIQAKRLTETTQMLNQH